MLCSMDGSTLRIHSAKLQKFTTVLDAFTDLADHPLYDATYRDSFGAVTIVIPHLKQGVMAGLVQLMYTGKTGHMPMKDLLEIVALLRPQEGTEIVGTATDG